ncbi:hypothetical protein RHGRI_013775 [Rhododendron griersonianum]|uniref:Glycine-rich protein n=1 Tax=Rhododendron griersonianum TaxID=479676 RepID=A0AAV6K6S4_9ERIC|nr:hypothetical protein RHGRI_013775 [Rhododendron griersonianum]
MEGTFTTSIQELVCCAPMLWWWRFGLGWCGGGSDSRGSEEEERGEGGREWWWRFGWVSELELGEWRMEGFQIGAEGFGFRKQRALNGGFSKKIWPNCLVGGGKDNFGSSWLF